MPFVIGDDTATYGWRTVKNLHALTPTTNPSGGTGGIFEDVRGEAYVASNGYGEAYHLWAAHIDPHRPIGLMTWFHGDGAYEYTNPDDAYYIAGDTGILAVARRENMILCLPKTPDDDGAATWLEWAGPNDLSLYAAELINMIIGQYNVDRNRVILCGFSGGAEFLSYNLIRDCGTLLNVTGGGQIMIGGGTAPADTVSMPDLPFKADWFCDFIVGEDDTAANSDEGFDAVAAATRGTTWWSTRGWDASLTVVPDQGHLMNGAYGGLVADRLAVRPRPAEVKKVEHVHLGTEDGPVEVWRGMNYVTLSVTTNGFTGVTGGNADLVTFGTATPTYGSVSLGTVGTATFSVDVAVSGTVFDRTVYTDWADLLDSARITGWIIPAGTPVWAIASISDGLSFTTLPWTAATNNQTVTCPAWARYVDILCLGAGGGGAGGGPNSGNIGAGGGAGSWQSTIWTVTPDRTLVFTIGTGGAGGATTKIGTAGGATTATCPEKSFVATAAGGAGGSGYTNTNGKAPGGYTYVTFNDIPPHYAVGGGTAATATAGSFPGGGGGPGARNGAGMAGAAGAAYYRFRSF